MSIGEIYRRWKSEKHVPVIKPRQGKSRRKVHRKRINR